MDGHLEVIVIGGSAGCLNTLFSLLSALPKNLQIPIIVVLHRSRNVVSEMDKVLSFHSLDRVVIEPDDKEPIEPRRIYLAPQNYHLLVESDRSFSLDYSEAVKYSRPSIDVTFESVANVYAANVLAILLSGSNADGTAGVERVLLKQGPVIVQDPSTTDYPFMPKNAIDNNTGVKVLTPDAIRDYLQALI